MRTKWVIVLIVATVLLSFMEGGIDFVLREPNVVENRIRTDYTQIGILLGVLDAISIIILGPFGRLSDLRGRRKLIIFWVLLPFVYLAYAFFAYALPPLYMLGLLRTLLFCMGWVALLAWMTEEATGKERSRILSVVFLGNFIGTVAGPAFLGILADSFMDLSLGLIAGAVITLVFALPLLFTPESSRFESKNVKRGELRDLRTIVHDSTLLALSLSSLLISAVGAIILFMMLPFLEEFYGLNLAEAGGLSMLVGAVAAVGFVFSGFMMGKWTGLRKRLILAFLLADSVFLVSAPFILIQSLWVLIVALSVEGFVLGVLFPAFLVLTADYCPEKEAGTELGAFQGITSAGYVVGYFLAGILWDVGFVMGGAAGGLLFCMLASVPLALIPIPLIIYKTRETKTQ